MWQEIVWALRAEHKDRYAPLRIDEKAVSSLLDHYKAGCMVRLASSQASLFGASLFKAISGRKIGAIADDVQRKCEVISRQQ